jgi:hypothetical protein
LRTATDKCQGGKEKKRGIKEQKRLMHDRPSKGASVCRGKNAGTEKYIYTVNSGAMERWVGMKGHDELE